MSSELLKEKGFLVGMSIVSLALAAGMIYRSKQEKAGARTSEAVDLEHQ